MLKSRLFVVVVSSIILAAVSAGAQTYQPGGPLVVRDANGHVVGQYDAFGRVNILINGHPVLFDVEPARLALFGVNLYFDQPNCQGTAYLDSAQFVSYVTTPAAFAPDGTVRIAPSRTSSSHLVASNYSDETSQCTNQAATLTTALATETGPAVRSAFTAPFAAAPGTLPALVVDVPMNHRVLLAGILAAVLLIGIIKMRH
jgi:hypothetical protein